MKGTTPVGTKEMGVRVDCTCNAVGETRPDLLTQDEGLQAASGCSQQAECASTKRGCAGGNKSTAGSWRDASEDAQRSSPREGAQIRRRDRATHGPTAVSGTPTERASEVALPRGNAQERSESFDRSRTLCATSRSEGREGEAVSPGRRSGNTRDTVLSAVRDAKDAASARVADRGL